METFLSIRKMPKRYRGIWLLNIYLVETVPFAPICISHLLLKPASESHFLHQVDRINNIDKGSDSGVGLLKPAFSYCFFACYHKYFQKMCFIFIETLWDMTKEQHIKRKIHMQTQNLKY